MMLPTTNGAQVTRLLKQRHPHIPVLGLTSFIDSPLVPQMLHAGAAECPQKSVTPAELVGVIRRLVAAAG